MSEMLSIEQVRESFDAARKSDHVFRVRYAVPLLTKVLSVLALPFLLVTMLMAPLMGLHFCPGEAMPLLAVAGSLPFIGPAVRRLRDRFGRKNHCCEPEHFKMKPSFDAHGRVALVAHPNRNAPKPPDVSEDILPVTCADGHVGCHADEHVVEGGGLCYCTRVRGIHSRRTGCPEPRT